MRVEVSPSHSHATFANCDQLQELLDWYARPGPAIKPLNHFGDGMLHSNGGIVSWHDDYIMA
jgi:hypothetical protein